MENELFKIFLIGTHESHDYADYEGKTYFGTLIRKDNELTPQILSDAALTEAIFEGQEITFQNYLVQSKKNLLHLEEENQAAFDYLQSEFPEQNIREEFAKMRGQLANLREAERTRMDRNTLIPTPEEEVEITPTPVIPVSESDIDYEAANDEVEKDKFGRGAVIAAGVVGAVVGAGLHHMFTPQIPKETNIKQDNYSQTIAELNMDVNLNELSVEEAIQRISNPDQRKFASQINKTFHRFYQATHSDNNFRLEEDQDAYLNMLPSELEAITLTLNDYSKILGEKYPDFISGFNQTETEMRANFLSGWQKLSVYYMNATQPSGISDLIHDSENKAFFEEMENRVLKFNANPTQENATDVWRNVYYNYIIAGSTGNYQNSSGQESVRANVATLAYSAPYGIAMSHRNVPEMFIVNLDNAAEKASANVGEAFLQSGTEFLPVLDKLTNEFNQNVIENEDTNKDYNPMDFGKISINEGVNQRGLCADVFTHISAVTRDMSEYRNNNSIALSQARNISKAILIDSLRQAGELGLAAELNDANVVDEALLNKISTSKEARTAVEQYRQSMDKHGKDVVTYSDVSQRMTNEAYKYLVNKPASSITKDDAIQTSEAEAMVIMTNNRFKNVVKEIDLTDSKVVAETPVVVAPVVTEQKTETKQVEKADLPVHLQEEATKQENEIVAEIAKDNTPGRAQEDAVDYANSTRYDAKAELAKYIPNSNLNYYSSQRYLAAYTGRQIDVNSDSQIQQAVGEDLSTYLNSLSAKEQAGLQSLYGDGWRAQISDTYKSNWMNELSSITSRAYNDGLVHGEELRKANDAALEEAQKKVDELNANAQKTEETTTEKAPTTDAEAPKEVPKETETKEEVTPPAENTQPPVKEEEVVVPQIVEENKTGDPNIDIKVEEGEVVIEPSPGKTGPEVIEKPIDQTPAPAPQEVTVPSVPATEAEQKGVTQEQGGAAITEDDQAAIDAMKAAQEAAQAVAEPTTEVSQPVTPIVTPAPEVTQPAAKPTLNFVPVDENFAEQKTTLAETVAPTQPTAPAITDDYLDLSEIEAAVEEVEVEPVKVR